MGVNKIEINTGNGKETLINISDSTVTPETLTEGYTAYGANGEPVNGINPYELNATNEEVNAQAELIAQIQAALVGKSTIPDGYIKPEGTISITENGVYDVTNYAAVEVNVAGSGGSGGGSVNTCTIHVSAESIVPGGGYIAVTQWIDGNAAASVYMWFVDTSLTIENVVCGSVITARDMSGCVSGAYLSDNMTYIDDDNFELSGPDTFVAIIAPTESNAVGEIRFHW